MPPEDGTAGQVLATDGNGGRYWTDQIGDTESFVKISPPSTGLYALHEAGNITMTAGTAKFTLTSKQAVVLVSSAPNSTKKFKITVDDNGTLSATEVTL